MNVNAEQGWNGKLQEKLRYANKDLLHTATLSTTKPTPSALGLSLDQLIAELLSTTKPTPSALGLSLDQLIAEL